MFCHLPVAAPVRSTADLAGLFPVEPSNSAQFPADALLVFGREARDAHLSLAVHEQGGALLPQGSGLATLLLSNHLLQECLEEREGQRPRLTPHEREMLRIELRANVSHALRSPLTAIKGSAETLLRLEQRIGQPERREFLQTITEASDAPLSLTLILKEGAEKKEGLKAERREGA